jgi:hypothetical protein
VNADPLDNRPSPGLRRERLTGQVGLDELSDQLWIAVVESVRTWDRDGFNVGQHPQTRRIGDLDEWITQTGDHQCRNDEMVKPFQGWLASHRPEQRQASKHPEPQIIPGCDWQQLPGALGTCPRFQIRERAPSHQHQGLRQRRTDGTRANYQRSPIQVAAEVPASWTQLGSRFDLVDHVVSH